MIGIVNGAGPASNTRKRSAQESGCERNDQGLNKRQRLGAALEDSLPQQPLLLSPATVDLDAAENPDFDGHQIDPISALPIELFWHILMVRSLCLSLSLSLSLDSILTPRLLCGGVCV